MQQGHELNLELVVSDSGSQCDSDLISTVLAELQRRLGDLPPGVTLTLSVGVLPPVATEADPAVLMEPDVKQWYSPKEVAALHDVKVATVRRWVDDGRFPGMRRLPNGAIRIPKGEVDAVLSAPHDPTAAAAEEPASAPRPASARAWRKEPTPSKDLPNFTGWRDKVRRPS